MYDRLHHVLYMLTNHTPDHTIPMYDRLHHELPMSTNHTPDKTIYMHDRLHHGLPMSSNYTPDQTLYVYTISENSYAEVIAADLTPLASSHKCNTPIPMTEVLHYRASNVLPYH